MTWRIVQGDCREAMAALPEASVDAIVCDPPYGLAFMGKAWDTLAAQQSWHEAWAHEALRVLKPGGHLLAFGGTRTFHRLACALEDAGFEIRDTLCWLYGSGFPKSLDVSKAIDKAAGAEREVIGQAYGGGFRCGNIANPTKIAGPPDITVPATEAAQQWQGWGTALKPAFEPIILARKPLGEGTVAGNVLAHGTGALNVDACRIGTHESSQAEWSAKGASRTTGTTYGVHRPSDSMLPTGRWPANLVLSHTAECNGACAPDCPVRLLDEQSGETGAFAPVRGSEPSESTKAIYGERVRVEGAFYGDTGGASRFFYCAKTAPAERGDDNTHPTVKPVELMRWLVRLVTPPKGTVLDPFTGSGTTGIAALREGFDFIGIEQDAAYLALARRRLIDDAPLFNRLNEQRA